MTEKKHLSDREKEIERLQRELDEFQKNLFIEWIDKSHYLVCCKTVIAEVRLSNEAVEIKEAAEKGTHPRVDVKRMIEDFYRKNQRDPTLLDLQRMWKDPKYRKF